MAKMMCSADGHVQEPWTLWSERLPASMRDRFTGIRPARGDMQRIVIDDRPYMDHTLFRRPDGTAIEPDPDGKGRIRDLESDGIWAETLVPNAVGFAIYAIADPVYGMACARVINDYMAQVYLPNFPRQIPIGVVPLGSVELAVAEIERLAKLGIPGVNLPSGPPVPYYSSHWEPVWRAASEHHMRINFHVGTGAFLPEGELGMMMGAGPDPSSLDERGRMAMQTTPAALGASTAQMQRIMGGLVGAGVAERYPDLHFICVESGASWLACSMEAMDAAWSVAPAASALYENGTWKEGFQMITYSTNQVIDDDDPDVDSRIVGGYDAKKWTYPLSPSDYIRRQFHFTFIDEVSPIKAIGYTGVDPILWGADYPHPEGTWPRSRETTDRFCEGLAPEDREAILGGTLAKLYDIGEVPDMPALSDTAFLTNA
jgi:predicted TIM-barrel fold metal-dependent hydrolase